MGDVRKTSCPQCGRQFEVDPHCEPAHMPFCSERCQWVDLGRWLNDEYRISKSLLSSDDEQED